MIIASANNQRLGVLQGIFAVVGNFTMLLLESMIDPEDLAKVQRGRVSSGSIEPVERDGPASKCSPRLPIDHVLQ